MPAQRQVLVVDPRYNIRAAISSAWNSEKDTIVFEAISASQGLALARRFRRTLAAIIVGDVLTSMSAGDMIQSLRDEEYSGPVVMLHPGYAADVHLIEPVTGAQVRDAVERLWAESMPAHRSAGCPSRARVEVAA